MMPDPVVGIKAERCRVAETKAGPVTGTVTVENDKTRENEPKTEYCGEDV